MAMRIKRSPGKFSGWVVTALALAGLVCGSTAQAQDPAASYPDKPVHIISAFAVGGGTDIVGRLIAEKLSESFGQSFIVENRAGANGTIATRNVLEAPADGYTLLMGGSTPMVFNPITFVNLPYNAEDLCPVTITGSDPLIILAKEDLPVTSLSELVDLAKQRRLTYGSPGGAFQVMMEHFSSIAGIKMTFVPYPGSGQAIQDLLTGSIDVVVSNAPSTAALFKEGKLKAIALTSTKGNPLFEGVPTVAESGYPDYEAGAFSALGVHCATPPAIVEKLQQAVAKALDTPELKERFAQLGVDPGGDTPAEAAARIKREIELYGPIAKAAGIRVGQ